MRVVSSVCYWRCHPHRWRSVFFFLSIVEWSQCVFWNSRIMSPGFCNIVSEIIIGVWYANTLLFLPTKNPSKPPLTPSSPFSHGFHPPTRCAEFDLMEVEEGNSHLQDADRWRQPALLLSVLCSLLHRWRHKCKGPCAPSCSQKITNVMPPVHLCSGLACTYQIPRVSFYVENKKTRNIFCIAQRTPLDTNPAQQWCRCSSRCASPD